MEGRLPWGEPLLCVMCTGTGCATRGRRRLSVASASTLSWLRAKDTYVGSCKGTRATAKNRGFIALWTRMRLSIGRLRTSAPSSHGRFSVDFTTNMVESDFRYTQ